MIGRRTASRRGRIVRSAAILAVVAWPAGAGAQTVLTCAVSGQSGKCSPTVTLDRPATMVNPALMQLTVSPTTSSYTPGVADMDLATGLTTPSIVSLSVMGNRSWTVQVNANAAFWTASPGAWTSKPASDLLWSLTPAGATTAVTTTAKTVTTGSAGPGTPTIPVYMRPMAHWATDKPGTYSLTVTFTLTTP